MYIYYGIYWWFSVHTNLSNKTIQVLGVDICVNCLVIHKDNNCSGNVKFVRNLTFFNAVFFFLHLNSTPIDVLEPPYAVQTMHKMCNLEVGN